jgi:arsenate reductase-like glutaredoxin family protein
MTITDNEILLIYNSGKQSDRKALGYAKALREYTVKERDISRDALTETQLKEVANKLGVTAVELLDRESDIYRDKYRSASVSETDLLITLTHEPELLRTPIALYADHAEFVDPYTFVKRGMAPPDITSGNANPGEK